MFVGRKSLNGNFDNHSCLWVSLVGNLWYDTISGQSASPDRQPGTQQVIPVGIIQYNYVTPTIFVLSTWRYLFSLAISFCGDFTYRTPLHLLSCSVFKWISDDVKLWLPLSDSFLDVWKKTMYDCQRLHGSQYFVIPGDVNRLFTVTNRSITDKATRFLLLFGFCLRLAIVDEHL